jgi:serine/threonine-protein kinase
MADTPSPDLATLQAALGDRYRIERELGRGGMAAVYLARDLRHDRAVAIKALAPHLGPTGIDRFLHEIRIAARLTHPHVLGVHDSGEAHGLLYYVMPYVAGETLRARLDREGALPVADVARLLRDLADALAYAHGAGIVHRDLKPENVLLSAGHAVVADFGIAKALAAATHGDAIQPALTATGISLGTPAYMAPEQAVGGGAIDARADLYALGVVAYEALAGSHPFAGRSAQGLVTAHLTETPVPVGARRRDTPPPLAALVMQLLAKEPDARPASAEAVLRALDPAPIATRDRARSWRGAAAAALVLIVAAAGYVLWRGLTMRDARPDASSAVAVRTVAVLPFVNTGGDPADDYFSDGITDELAHALTRVPGVRLAGRTSSYAFKGRNVAAQEIGRTLDVGSLVSGTVRRAGGRLRMTAQLVSTADGKVVWDSVYESRAGDVFAVQDELTTAVVTALAPLLGERGPAHAAAVAQGARGTTDAEAYELYLKGRYHWLERGRANVERSIGYFQQAIARDPAFARAHAGLALAYGVLPVYVFDASDSATPLIAASARRALALDSTVADAHIALAIALERRVRVREAEAHHRVAVALEPANVTARQALGLMLVSLGRTDEALTDLRLAAQLDPLAKSVGTGYALALISARRYPEAAAATRRTLALDSTFPLALWTLGLVQTFGGQPDSAVHTLELGVRLYPTSPGLNAALVLAYAAAGRWADAERMRAQLRRPEGAGSGGVVPAFAELVFGNRDPLVQLLTTPAGQRRWLDTGGVFGCNPLLDPLWEDTRFRGAMRDAGIAPCSLARPWPLPPRP